MNKCKQLLLVLVVFCVSFCLAFADEKSNFDIYKYMANILAPAEEGHNSILDSDIVIYSSRLYYQGQFFESIRILKHLKPDHDSIYWLWKNEIAICDKLCSINKKGPEANQYKNYIKENGSYFVYNNNIGRYFPSLKRYQESEKVYSSNEFLPEMNIYNQNVKKVNELKLKK